MEGQILSLPRNIICKIYTYASGSENVDIEVDESGILLTRACKFLRICKSIRHSIFEGCEQGHLQSVHTVRSPKALSTFWTTTRTSAGTIRFVLLALLEGLKLTEQEERGSSRGPNIEPLFKAWREAFRAAPDHIELAYFDLVRDFRLDPKAVARLIHNLSVVLNHRTHGAVKCRIIGCRTVQGQLYIEKSTCNVIKSDSSGVKRKIDPYVEYLAGPPLLVESSRGEVEDQAVPPRPRVHVYATAPGDGFKSTVAIAGKKRKVEEMS